ncbi:DNA repair protein RAD50 [Zancudomyces culisetae]|uniref:DNA repair protein RAD50 n=1 Tax=Zancudomyces culisetae TaxID=1213189 RepID=A0A1R1PEV0_ZANCU|nr:DNA repair protein RAD50 [Zancudomyces culisetae]|eukprot:OMH79520.1 DNA repair protein RAD50 [Zancudomyces culisetae]
MSAIDKIMIRGIRSFDPKEASLIEFESPLTLIVGANGCGKTTIIECLKYATTGELPPNSKGAAFINDPKIVGERDVKAQVKLKFRNVREESNWPLSEPLQLKRKFDDIFAATRYTKAIETIKKIRKDQMVELKVQSTEVKFYRENKKKSDKLKEEYEMNKEKAGGIQTRIEEVEQQEKAYKRIYERYMMRKAEYQEKSTAIEKAEHEIKVLEENIRTQREHLEEMHESTEELQRMQQEQQAEIESRKRSVRINVERRAKIEGRIGSVQREIKQKQGVIAKLEAQKAIIDKEVFGRNSMLLDVVKENGLHVSNEIRRAMETGAQIDEEDIGVIVALIKKRVVEYKSGEEKLRSESKHNEEEVRQLIKQSEAKIIKMKEQKTQCNKEHSTKRQQIASIRSKVSGTLEDCEQQKVEITIRLQNSERCKEKLLEKIKNANANETLQAKKQHLQQIEEQIKQINERASQMQQRSQLMGKVDMTKGLLEQVKKEHSQVEEQVKAQEESGVMGVQEAKDQLNHLNKQLEKYRMTLNNVEGSIEEMEKRLKSYLCEVKEKEGQLAEVVQENEYEDQICEVQKQANTAIETVSRLKSEMGTHKSYVVEAENTKCCPLCYRGWENPSDVTNFLDSLKSNYEKAPLLINAAQKKLDEAQALVQKLRQLQPMYSRIQELKTSIIPDTEERVKQLILEKSTIQTQMEAVVQKKAHADIDYQNALQLDELAGRKTDLCQRMSGYEQDLEKLGAEYERLSGTKGVDMGADDLTRLTQSSQNIREEMDKLTSEMIAFQQEVSSTENEIHKLKVALGEAEARSNMLRQVAQLQNEVSQLDAKIQHLDLELSQLSDHLSKNQLRLHQQQSTSQRQIDELHRTLDLWVGIEHRVDNYISNIQRYTAELANAGSITNIEAEIADLESRISGELTSEYNAIQLELSQAEKWIENSTSQTKAVADNLRIRSMGLQLQALQDNLSQLCSLKAHIYSQLLDIIDEEAGEAVLAENVENTSQHTHTGHKRKVDDWIDTDNSFDLPSRSKRSLENHQRFSPENDKLTRFESQISHKINSLSLKVASMTGEYKQIESQLNWYKTELKTNYKDIDKLYLDKMVEFQTLDLCQKDLDKYLKALDAAIMKYHSEKMAQINKIIRDLWQDTYMADDIDTIEIRSEKDGASNRSYNYRVVMLKDGIAIDMRGRCSAGQKVLASLVIRLALAESFAINCGILALDEPTTNLDKANIESLAASLSRIIEARMDRPNFQLIIITHDEEFLDLLGKSNYTDHYWKVLKSSKQFSYAKKFPITN